MNASWFAQNVVSDVIGVVIFTAGGYALAKVGAKFGVWEKALLALLQRPKVQAMLGLPKEPSND